VIALGSSDPAVVAHCGSTRHLGSGVTIGRDRFYSCSVTFEGLSLSAKVTN
jgi:hypothetical protein